MQWLQGKVCSGFLISDSIKDAYPLHRQKVKRPLPVSIDAEEAEMTNAFVVLRSR